MRNPLTPPYQEAKLKFGFRPDENISHAWYHFKDYNFTIMAPNKCGSASIRQFIWMNEIEDRIDINQIIGEACVVVRDPVSRFCSLWRSKCSDKTNLTDKRIYGFTPEELMSHIEAGHKDEHWTSQTELIGNLDPTLIPLEHLNEWWFDRGYGKLGNFNVTEGSVDINPKRIIDFYWEDMELYAKAVLDFQHH